MVRLDDMRLFAALADASSLTAAARELGIPKQTVSRRLADLERDLGVELARRTTRTLSLTDVGRAYATRCREVARLAREANEAVREQRVAPSGTVRVTADHTFGQAFLPELVLALSKTHPRVDVAIELTSRRVDLVEEGFDVAFRVGAPPDVEHLAATRLGPARLWTVATRGYLRRRGTPDHPSDLVDHDNVGLVPSLRHRGWPFRIGDELQLVDVPMKVRVNDLAVARQAALRGIGLVQLPSFAVTDDITRGRLEPVLADYAPEVGGVHVVYPHSRLLLPKVRALVALASERFAGRLTEPRQR